MKTRVAVLISGRGSNLLSLIKAAPYSDYEIAVVVSDQEHAPGLKHAEDADILWVAMPHKTRHDFAAMLWRVMVDMQIDLIVLAGFMRILDAEFVNKFAGRIVNIHPSLLPQFPGLHPYRQTLAAGVSYSGCTVHYVVPEVDAGPIIAQAVVDVLKDDTEEILSARILEAEHKLYPIVIDHLSRTILKEKGVRDMSE